MPEVTVEIQHPVFNADGLPENVYGFLIQVPSGPTKSEQAYVAFIVDHLDKVGETHISSAARSLSQFVQEPERQAEYRDAIEAKVQEALAGAA